jgi:hypothetical protein
MEATMTTLRPSYVQSISRLACTACGAEANASCNCGKPYVPKEIAKEAIKANPEKSNRAIAEEIGTSPKTVNKARKELGEEGSSPERTGRDGKTYPAATKAPKSGSAEYEREGAECIRLGQKSEAAERELLDAKGEAGDSCLMIVKAKEVRSKMALDLIDAGFRALLEKHHPDNGGSFGGMALVVDVRDRLKHLWAKAAAA